MYRLELEGLRGIAALMVVIYHIPKWHPALNINLIENGYLMVDLFFVLSGFVIYKAYGQNISDLKDILKFHWLRFGRLYPVHILFFVLFVLIEFYKWYSLLHAPDHHTHSEAFEKNNPTAAVQQILLLQAIYPHGNAITFNGPAWSISVEFYVYVIFSLITLFLKKLNLPVLIFLSVIPVIMLAINKSDEYELFLRGIAGFFTGCLTASIGDRVKIKCDIGLQIISFLIIIIFLLYKINKNYDPIIYLASSFLIFTIYYANNENKGLNAILKSKYFILLGMISYSLYMSHSFIIFLVINFFKRVMGKIEYKNVNGGYDLVLESYESIAASFAIPFFSILLAIVVYKLVEYPLRIKSRNIATKYFN